MARSIDTIPVKPLNDVEQDLLESLFAEGERQTEVHPQYWVYEDEEGESYCHECGTRQVEKLMKDDPKTEHTLSWADGAEGDHLPCCAVCGKHLSAVLTQYGCEEEVVHFLEYGFDPESDYECYAMSRVIASNGFTPEHFGGEPSEHPEYYNNLRRLCHSILLRLPTPKQRERLLAGVGAVDF